MPSVVQRENPNSRRGRPRKLYPRLAERLAVFCVRSGWSRTKAFAEMAAGRLRYRQDRPGGPREILTSEYVRLGFVRSLDELSDLFQPPHVTTWRPSASKHPDDIMT